MSEALVSTAALVSGEPWPSRMRPTAKLASEAISTVRTMVESPM